VTDPQITLLRSLADTDVLLIGSQILEFQRLGSPAAPRADADGTRRVGSLTPTPDIARLSQLRAEVASMAVLAASKILGKEVDANTHKVLIERSLDEAGDDLGKLN